MSRVLVLMALLSAPASANMLFGNRVRISGDTMTGQLTNTSTITILGAGGLGVTYGVTASTFQAGDGTASTPSYRGATSGLGMYFTSGGTPSVNFITNGVTIAGSANGTKICGGSGLANGQACLRAGSSITNPGLQWINDANTGLHWVSADKQELVAGGVAGIDHTATTVTIFPNAIGSSTFTINGGAALRGNVAQTAYALSIDSNTGVGASVFGVTGGGHIVSSGTTPSIVCNVGTPAMSADSNDMSGEYTGGALSVNCTITFVTAWAKKPRCFCNDETNIVALQAITTTTTLKCSAVAATGTDLISYFCWGSP